MGPCHNTLDTTSIHFIFRVLLQSLHIANLDYVFRLDYKLRIKQINYCSYYDY
jgi:hypothetical protein